MHSDNLRTVLLEMIEIEIWAASRRSQFLPSEISNSNGWRIALELFRSRIEGQHLSARELAVRINGDDTETMGIIASCAEFGLIDRGFESVENGDQELRLVKEKFKEMVHLFLGPSNKKVH